MSQDQLRDWMQQGTDYDFLLMVEYAAEILSKRLYLHDEVVAKFVEAIDRGWCRAGWRKIQTP